MRRAAMVMLLACASLAAQRTLEYDRSVVSQVRIDLRDLGYPPRDVIPPDESAIGALAVAPSGSVYGVTAGKRSHLFVLAPAHGYIQPLGFLKGAATAVAISKSGDVYVGGERLHKYTPGNEYARPIRVDAPVDAADLGSPAPGERIHALAARGDTIYGLTSPGGHFFSYSGKLALHGKVAERGIPGEKFEDEKNIGHALAVCRGSAFTSGEGGMLYRFNGLELERLPVAVPAVRGREPYNGVDAWAAAGDILYGGTSDGYLFRFDPETLKIENLGKPLNQYRIRGLVHAANGKLYGVGGDDDEMARLFSYDPAHGVYEMLGFIDVNRRPYYTWQAYVVGAMAIGLDGTVYIGQAERMSKLYLYYPEP